MSFNEKSMSQSALEWPGKAQTKNVKIWPQYYEHISETPSHGYVTGMKNLTFSALVIFRSVRP